MQAHGDKALAYIKFSHSQEHVYPPPPKKIIKISVIRFSAKASLHAPPLGVGCSNLFETCSILPLY